MRVLFIARATLYANSGGDTVQILSTAKYLQQLQIDVDIKLCNEKIDYRPYNIIHFFNVIRSADILKHIQKSKKPYVLSTIYVDYSEFEKKTRKGLSGPFFKMFSRDSIEYIKVIGRRLFNNEKIVSRRYLWWGQRASMKYVLKNAALLLPNSHNEYIRLARDYETEKGYQVIPNGFDEQIFTQREGDKEKDLVLCVGRIEPLKNQLNLIKALNHTHYRLMIVGSPSTNHQNYYTQCKQAAAENVQFIDSLSQTELVKYYSRAKVHVLPSWFETTGLSSLEAAAMDCSIVITDKGDAKEYFQDMAFYCEPDSVNTIKTAVDKAASTNCNCQLKQVVHKHYTWKIAAEKTLQAYNRVLPKV